MIENATRRAFLGTMVASASLGTVRATWQAGAAPLKGDTTMYGLIGKMTATPGQRDALIAILLEGTSAMPGCLSYVVARDPADADGIWITEVWDSEASHKASLALPAVQDAITRGRPLIAGFSDRRETLPVGGVGLNGGPASSTPGD